jgi:polyferredoxin
MEKIDRSYVRYTRYAIQWAVFFFLIYAGYRFYFFVEHFLSGTAAVDRGIMGSRLPSVEGFLPIGALMGLKLWLVEGVFDHIHPAGLVIFIGAILLAIFLKKGFCGWICPVGAISDAVWKLGRKVFGRNFSLPKYADIGLRSIKYLLLSFFFYVIVIRMPSFAILRFLEGDYYKIADVKMLFFFTEMTTTTAVTLSLLFVFSILYKNFWCRYLCPYGALLGLLSMLSPLKIRRSEQACIHCGKCTKNCPSQLPVESLASVRSPECTGCLTCVSHCPAKGALDVALPKRRVVNPVIFGVLIIAVFFGAIVMAKMSGNWESSISYDEYRRIIPQSRQLDHP